MTHFLFRYKVRLGLVSLVSCVAVGALLADLASSSPPVAQTTRTVVKGSLQGTNISGPTRTTATPPDPPAPITQQGPVPLLPQRVPTNPPTVSNIPAAPCPNADLKAAVTNEGIPSMSEYQLIVTVTSNVPCRVDGFPSVALSGLGIRPVIDGGTLGKSTPPMDVAVENGESASFLIQVPQNVTGCPVAKLYIGVPGTDPRVLVTVPPVIGDGSWPTCGSLMVSAFEQGNDPGQYLG